MVRKNILNNSKVTISLNNCIAVMRKYGDKARHESLYCGIGPLYAENDVVAFNLFNSLMSVKPFGEGVYFLTTATNKLMLHIANEMQLICVSTEFRLVDLSFGLC
jgi:hypothetical protein